MQNVDRPSAYSWGPRSSETHGALECGSAKRSYQQNSCIHVVPKQRLSCSHLRRRKLLTKNAEGKGVREFEFAQRRNQERQGDAFDARRCRRGIGVQYIERSEETRINVCAQKRSRSVDIRSAVLALSGLPR